MWEIWARTVQPWDEVKEDGIQFNEKLEQLVSAGQRPTLPMGCKTAPEGYLSLVVQWWSSVGNLTRQCRPGTPPQFCSNHRSAFNNPAPPQYTGRDGDMMRCATNSDHVGDGR
eukprot:m.425820 g.425820  ORF g.425820 m.425820 type:complete len:113 (-) comp54683_c0_seq1:267-605(-)